MTMWVLALALLLLPTWAWAQPEARGAHKGATDPVPVTARDVSADRGALDVWINNSLTTAPEKAATATLANVSGSASSVTCLAADVTRVAATFYNDSTSPAYLKLGTTASTTSYTVKLYQDGYYRLPGSYTGRVDCIWDSATGAMRVTELKP